MNLTSAFPHLREEDRALLASMGSRIAVRSDQPVLHEGEKTEALYVTIRGMFRVTRSYDAEHSLEFAGPLGPGDLFGEMSFLDDRPSSATLVADGDSEVLKLEGEAVRKLIAENDAFAAGFYKSVAAVLSRRLRQTSNRVLQPPMMS
ncbi:MAG: Crp/Fnr family transcriptional regulator [Magnetovibrionaceae bacterium]